MAEETQAAPAAAEGKPTKEDKDFAKRAAAAELDAQRIEDERREAVSRNELANYGMIKADENEGK